MLERTRCKEEARHVARGEIECGSTNGKTNNSDAHHDGNVPCPVVELARRDADADTDGASNE